MLLANAFAKKKGCLHTEASFLFIKSITIVKVRSLSSQTGFLCLLVIEDEKLFNSSLFLSYFLIKILGYSSAFSCPKKSTKVNFSVAVTSAVGGLLLNREVNTNS